MSMESAKAFVERMKNDEEFRDKVNECKDAEARKALVLKEGYDFTVEDIQSCVTNELSEEMLAGIVGGGTCGTLDFKPASMSPSWPFPGRLS